MEAEPYWLNGEFGYSQLACLIQADFTIRHSINGGQRHPLWTNNALTVDLP
jgi:hypothetical protein